MKKLQKLLLGGLFILSTASLASCASKADEIIIGITTYEPMDYRDENNNWIGFDADLARKVFGELGYKNVKLQVIEWDYKNVDLKTKTIDCIWNGMTITDDLKEQFAITSPYLTNFQYGVTKKENVSSYTSLSCLANKNVAVEGGSAAKDVVSSFKEDNEGFDCTVTECTDQNTAILNVFTGACDIAIVDYTLANTLTKEGTTYASSLSPVNLGIEKEEFGIAFRKEDQKLCDKVDAEIAKLYESGFMAELAATYGISGLLIK